MLQVEVTAVVVLQEASWQAADMVVWQVPGCGPEPVPLSKQPQDVVLDRGHQTRVAAWVAQRLPVEVWGVLASREPGT